MKLNTFIIAEAGVNHNGSLDMALQLVDVAVESGADAVKFQTFKADKLATRKADKAAYQKRTTEVAESQFEMLKKLELSIEMHKAILEHCRQRGIEFLSTPFDAESLAYLTEELGLTRIKMPSGEITNGPLLLETARRAQQIILSTGMATLAEVEAALAVFVWGLTCTDMPGSFDEIEDNYVQHGTDPLRGRVTLLHCTTEYPAAFEDANLRAMDTMRAAFGLDVGFSDHTPGIFASIAATARGAVLIEKHFTLNRNLPGPDHAASLEPDELCEMVRGIRAVEKALGDDRKIPVARELGNRAVVRKSIVAARDIPMGQSYSGENLALKRPGTGISPMRYWDMLGRKAEKDYALDAPIS